MLRCYAVVKFGGLLNNKHWLLGQETKLGAARRARRQEGTSKKSKKKKKRTSAKSSQSGAKMQCSWLSECARLVVRCRCRLAAVVGVVFCCEANGRRREKAQKKRAAGKRKAGELERRTGRSVPQIQTKVTQRQPTRGRAAARVGYRCRTKTNFGGRFR